MTVLSVVEVPAAIVARELNVRIIETICIASYMNYKNQGEIQVMKGIGHEVTSMRAAGNSVHCFKQDCYWLDIGRHDDYATANDIFEARRTAFLGSPAAPKLRIGRDQ